MAVVIRLDRTEPRFRRACPVSAGVGLATSSVQGHVRPSSLFNASLRIELREHATPHPLLPVTKTRTFIFALCCGAIVANLYYAQPMIGLIAPDIGLSVRAAGWIVSVTQIGYALGLLFLVPLGDVVENRALMIATTAVGLLALTATVFVSGGATFLVLALVVGIGSTSVQMMIPLVAHLAPDETRGRVVGSVMGGLLLGVMLARPVASFVAEAFGWRSVFAMAAALMFCIELVFVFAMPKRIPDQRSNYRRLLGSLGGMVVDEPVLRVRMAVHACMFASFTVFWTAVPLELARNHGLTQWGIGVFALIGATGAMAAPVGGRLADSGRTRPATLVALGGAAFVFLFSIVADHAVTGLLTLGLTGVLLDFLVQGNTVLGQREIYALDAEARSRMTALFMTSIFIGGAVGAAAATMLFERYGWMGAALAGGAFPIAALLIYVTLSKPSQVTGSFSKTAARVGPSMQAAEAPTSTPTRPALRQ